MLRVLGWTAALLAGAAGGAPALGQGSGAAGAMGVSPLFVEVNPHPGCDDGADLGRRVARRSPRIALAPTPAPEAARASVRISGDAASGFDATLALTTPNGRVWSRRLHAGTCDEAFDALAVVLAVTLDSRAVRAAPVRGPTPGAAKPPRQPRNSVPPPATAARDSVGPVEASAPTPAVPAKVEPAPPPAPEAVVEPPPPPEPPPPAPPPPPKPEPPPVEVVPAEPAGPPPPPAVLSLTAMVGGAGVVRLAPAMMGGATVAAWVAWSRASVVSPAVRLSVSRVWVDGYRTDAGGADFALDSAALHVCPVRFVAGRFGAFVCGAGLAGRLHAQGADTLMPQSHVRPFVAVGGAVLADLRLTHSIFLVLSFDVSAPLIRDSFQFRPEIFHQVPSTILGGAAGIGFRFL